MKRKKRAPRHNYNRGKIRLNGRYVNLDSGRRVAWTPELRAMLNAIEARYRGHYAPLRCMSAHDWNAMQDELPKCPCGRVVAPIRAKLVRADPFDPTRPAQAYCTARCRFSLAAARARRKAVAEGRIPEDKSATARAVSEALYQA